MTDNKIGPIRCRAASLGLALTQAEQRSPTSEVAPGRTFVLTNLEIFFSA